MQRKSSSRFAFIKDLALMLYVLVFAWATYLMFAVMWALLLLTLLWLVLNPLVIVAATGLYFVLFAPNFYPALKDDSLWQAPSSEDSARRA